MRDLRPYVCTYKDCKEADQQYDSFKQWLAHETNSHGTTGRYRDHIVEKASSTSMRQEQSSAQHLGNSDIAALGVVEADSTSAVAKRSCPICLDENVTPNHIGVHLQNIALFALPKCTGLEDDTSLSNASSVATDLESREDRFDGLEDLSFSSDDEVLQTQLSASVGSDLLTATKDQEQWNEAEKLEVLGMETSKGALKTEHPDSSIRMSSRALTYNNQGRWREAEELEMQVLEERKTLLGLEHPDTLYSMNNMVSIYVRQERWKEAEELQVKVLKMRKRVLGPEHPDTLDSMYHLSLIYVKQERWKEAETLQVEVLKMRTRVLGPEHPDTLDSMNYLTLIYVNQERWKEAEELGILVLEMRKRVLGPEHPNTLNSMDQLASIYENQGRWTEAEELKVEGKELRSRML